jgi:uncharacterized protein YndB with AHSA1/START domain
MNTTRSKVLVGAERKKVWAALTQPELVAKWQYGATLTTTWQVGDRITFKAEWQGQVFAQWGQVLEYREPDMLRYSLFAPRPGLADAPENYFEMVYLLEARETGTLVTIIQNDPRPREDEPAPEASDETNPVLQALKAVAEAL